MKSITKYNVSEAEILAAFAAAGISGAGEVKELSDGWYNSVFFVSDGQRKKYVIKIAPAKDVRVLTHEQNLMAAEVEFYRLINLYTSVITPKIVFSDFTGEIIPTAYFIMEFLSGERLDKASLSPEEKLQTDEQWAWILSEFHKIKGSGYGYVQTGLKGSWREALTHMTRMLIDDAASFGKKNKVGEKLLFYIDRFASELEGIPSVLVNFDLHAMNIFCQRTDEGLRLAVFDLERCFWGDPIGDLIMPEQFKPFPAKNILARYNRFAAAPLAVDRNGQIRYNLMNAYLGVIMYTERFSRFRGFKKYFSPIYLIGTIGYKAIAASSLAALKKLSDKNR